MTFQVEVVSDDSVAPPNSSFVPEGIASSASKTSLRRLMIPKDSLLPPDLCGGIDGNRASPASRDLLFASDSTITTAAEPAENAFIAMSRLWSGLAPSGSLYATTAPFVKTPLGSTTCSSPVSRGLLKNETRKSRPYS